MAAPNTKNVVEEDCNWTIRIRTEQKVAKSFTQEWGFLAETNTRPLGRSVSPVKYHRAGNWTVKEIRVPDKKGEVKIKLPDVAPERMKQVPLRPSTAMESVVMSSTLRSEAIEKCNPFFVQSSAKYGSRLSLEQFGISQHGIRASRTKLPSR